MAGLGVVGKSGYICSGMKHFRLITSTIILSAVAAFALNIVYLCMLYGSIADDLRRDVVASMQDMDIDEMWHRAIDFRRSGLGGYSTVTGSLRPGNDTIIMRESDEEGNERVAHRKKLVRSDKFGNQLAIEMSDQMHRQMDSVFPMNVNMADSILRERLAERGIRPEIVEVEAVDSTERVVVANPALTDELIPRLDVFAIPYGEEKSYSYRAYLSPLMGEILHRMQGVIVTTLTLIIIFVIGFWYLLRTVRRLRTLEEMKDDFTNNMTHELKTPISIAYSANDALLNFDTTNDPARKEAYLKIALKQLGRLGELVENILAMSMERRKTMELKRERVELGALVEELAAAQRMRSEKEIEIEVCGTAEAVTVEADRNHLANVVNNLVDNAIKYSGESVRIVITVGSNRISVADNGIGIPSKSLPYIFNKFYRVPHGNRQDVRGYGIGLFYVRQILDKMGWTVSVVSKPGIGSTFTIRFDRDE